MLYIMLIFIPLHQNIGDILFLPCLFVCLWTCRFAYIGHNFWSVSERALIFYIRPHAYKEMLSTISCSAQNRTQCLEFCSREFWTQTLLINVVWERSQLSTVLSNTFVNVSDPTSKKWRVLDYSVPRRFGPYFIEIIRSNISETSTWKYKVSA